MAAPTIAWAFEGVVLACLSVAVATDVARRIISNRLVLLVLACGIALRLLSMPSPLFLGILGPLAVLIALGLLAGYNLIGWGDAKLITAVSVAVPPERLLVLLFVIALAGGALACFYIACRFLLRWGSAQATGAPAMGVAGSGPAPTPCAKPVTTWMVDRSPGQAWGHGPATTFSAGGAFFKCLTTPLQVLRRERARIVAGEPLPYAVAIALGALYTIATG